MVRDTLALKGAMPLWELCDAMNLSVKDYGNLVQGLLIELCSAGIVSYDMDTGNYESEIRLV
jgi:hypothetical protein